MDAAARVKTYALLLLTAGIWGFQPSCVKWLAREWTPPEILMARFFVMAVVLLSLYARAVPQARFLPRGRAWAYFLVFRCLLWVDILPISLNPYKIVSI